MTLDLAGHDRLIQIGARLPNGKCTLAEAESDMAFLLSCFDQREKELQVAATSPAFSGADFAAQRTEIQALHAARRALQLFKERRFGTPTAAN